MEDERKPTYDELVVENTQLKLKVKQQESRILELEQQVAELKAQVARLTKMLFGKKSEKSKKKVQNAEDVASNEEQTSSDVALDTAPKKNCKRGGGGRKPFPPEIPRRDVHIDLPPDECRCANCGNDANGYPASITTSVNSRQF